MKNLFVLLAVCVMAFGLSACGEVKGTPVEYAQACSDANAKKMIEVSGFLDDKGSLFCSNIGGGPVKCGFRMLSAAGSAEKGFTADIVQGTYANNVEKLERGYKKEDIKIRDHTGAILNLNDKVKLTGKMNYTKSVTEGTDDICYLTVDKIEKQ